MRYILDDDIFHNDKFVEPGLYILGILFTHYQEEVWKLIDDEDDIDHSSFLGRKDGRAYFVLPQTTQIVRGEPVEEFEGLRPL
jgi:hypothetical protein